MLPSQPAAGAVPESVARFMVRLQKAPHIKTYEIIHSCNGLIPYQELNVRTPPFPINMPNQPRTKVSLKEITTAQHFLLRNKLLGMLEKPRLSEMRSSVMVAVEQEGRLYLVDGNHRANTLIAYGDEWLPLIVLQAKKPVIKNPIKKVFW